MDPPIPPPSLSLAVAGPLITRVLASGSWKREALRYEVLADSDGVFLVLPSPRVRMYRRTWKKVETTGSRKKEKGKSSMHACHKTGEYDCHVIRGTWVEGLNSSENSFWVLTSLFYPSYLLLGFCLSLLFLASVFILLLKGVFFPFPFCSNYRTLGPCRS